MMDDQPILPPPPKAPLILALVASLLWLVVAVLVFAFAVPGGLALPGGLQPFLLAAGFVLILAAPLALVWLAALNLRERAGVRAQRTALMAEQARYAERRLTDGAAALVMLEDRMTALAARIEAVGAPVEQQHAALLTAVATFEATGARLAAATGETAAATATLGSAIPDATSKAEQLTRLLEAAETTLQRQLQATETMLASLTARAADAEAQARATSAEATAGMAAIAEAGRRAQEAVAEPLARLVADTDAAFTRTAAAMDATRDGVHAQTNAMLASVDQARVTLDHIGGEAARQIHARLETLLGTAGDIGEALETHSGRARDLIDEIARGFTVLDAKLGNSAATGNNALDGIMARMADARDAIHRLGEPIAATESALAGVEARLGSVGSAANETLGSLGTALPAALPQLDDMAIRLATLHDRADQLSLPLTAGGDSIAAAQAQLDRAREALDQAATQLGEELATARNALSDIESMTGTTSLAASTQLIEVFGRVKDIANQTAGTMRETLSNVVAEAEAALDQAGQSRAELAFGVPIRAQLAQVEAMHSRVSEAAQAATERVTRRLLALTETVAGVEARIDEVDTRYEVRARNTLAARSGKLVESLQAAAIDIAGLLAFDIEDTAWDNYLKGDRSIFARRIVEQLDGDGLRAISRHFQHDPEFRSQATLYIEQFEALIAQVSPDREGKTLAVTLLSSNIGRLYVALGQAINRFR